MSMFRNPAVSKPLRSLASSVVAVAALSSAGTAAYGDQASGDRAASPDRAAVHGVASGPLTDPGFEGQRVRLRVTAHASADEPASAAGRFRYDHLYANGETFVGLTGRIDCLQVAGRHAVVTGRITEAVVPPGAEDIWTGLRVGFMVEDRGRHDRFGWSWQSGNVETDVPPCTSTIPSQRADVGDLRVVGGSESTGHRELS